MKFLFCGLGNPGPDYEDTRHNIGFMVVNHLADKMGIVFEPGRYASVAKGSLRGRKIVLIKPQTYMNLSGKAYRYWLKEENIELGQSVIITDDLAIPYGAIRLRKKGSDGGHNGLKSIQDMIATNQYPRLRMGIGNGFPKGGQVDFVLNPFNEDEKNSLPEIIKKAADCLESVVFQGLDKAMTNFNKG